MRQLGNWLTLLRLKVLLSALIANLSSITTGKLSLGLFTFNQATNPHLPRSKMSIYQKWQTLYHTIFCNPPSPCWYNTENPRIAILIFCPIISPVCCDRNRNKQNSLLGIVRIVVLFHGTRLRLLSRGPPESPPHAFLCFGNKASRTRSVSLSNWRCCLVKSYLHLSKDAKLSLIFN